MKILKIPKCKTKYKVRCEDCYSKLIVEAKDIINEKDSSKLFWGTILNYICPVCNKKQSLYGDDKYYYIQYVKIQNYKENYSNVKD